MTSSQEAGGVRSEDTVRNEGVGGVRASNSDRERVASVLRAAATEGLLTLDEVDERLAGAYGATYRHELGPLTADLPDGGRRLYAGSPEGMARRARYRDAARRGLIRHAAVVAAIAGAAVTLWALSPRPHFFPAPIIFIGLLTLVLHARRVGWAGAGWPGRWGGGGWGGGRGWDNRGWDNRGWDNRGWDNRGWDDRDWDSPRFGRGPCGAAGSRPEGGGTV